MFSILAVMMHWPRARKGGNSLEESLCLCEIVGVVNKHGGMFPGVDDSFTPSPQVAVNHSLVNPGGGVKVSGWGNETWTERLCHN